MKIGLISDTHDFFEPRLETIFAGVDHILHAGDVGSDWILTQLAGLAPVTAVLGNTNAGLALPLTQVKTLGPLKVLLHHIVTPYALTRELAARIQQEQPQLVVFGHTHQQFQQRLNGTWFLNPGYAGKPKYGAERSVALLETAAGKSAVKFIKLPNPR